MAGPVQLLESATVGLAVGTAAADAFAPTFEAAKQKAWIAEQVQVLAASTAAQLRAQGAITDAQAHDEGSRTGLNASRVDALVQLALRAPGVGELLTLRRRQLIGDADFTHGLRKAMLESLWDGPLAALRNEVLDPAIIANAIVRGIMADPGFLPVGPPSGVGRVPAFPVSGLDTLTEASYSGVDADRLFVMTAINGRPMAPEEAAQAVFRNIIDRVDYDRAIAEGDLRNEWASAIFERTRQILTAHDHVELRLRGWYATDDEMYAGTALHGMSQDDTDRLFKVLGRPISYRNVFLGERRGGVYDGPTDAIEPPILKSLQESNLRPEWYDLANHLVETKPTLFFVRTWLKDGHPPDRARTWLYQLGYSADDIDAIVLAYSTTAGAAADPHVKSAVTSAYTALKKEYVNGTLSEAEVASYQTALANAQTAANPLLAVYAVLRAIENPGAATAGAPTGI